MYKKIIFSSILFFAFIILIDKAFFNSKEKEIPNPEWHIRHVMVLLQTNDLNGFKNLVFPMKDFKKMKKEEGVIFLSGFQDMDESMASFAWDLIQDIEDNYMKEYEKSFENNFKEVRKDFKKLDDFQIEKIQWKLVWVSNANQQYRCNAKIYIKSNKQYFCVKYKNFIYFKGKWFAGQLTDVNEIYEPDNDYFPNMYQEPSLEEYINRSNESVTEEAEEALETEPEAEDAPKAEED